MSWAVRRLDDVPTVPRTDEDDPDWRPLQHFFRLTAFGANVFVARRGHETLVEEHDERTSGQEELYLVLEGEVEFEVGGETFVAGRGTAIAVPEPAVKRRAVARTAGASLLVVGSRPGCSRRPGALRTLRTYRASGRTANNHQVPAGAGSAGTPRGTRRWSRAAPDPVPTSSLRDCGKPPPA
jgi:hypothetical protein